MPHTSITPQAPPSTMPSPPAASEPPQPAAPQKGALEKLVEQLTHSSIALLLLGFLYLKVYGFASPRSRGSSSSSSSRHVLSSIVGGAGEGRQGDDELREIMVLAKQAQMRGEIAQYGGLNGWLEHYIQTKKAILPGATPVFVVEAGAQPDLSSASPAQERAKASAGSYFFTALMASLFAAAVLHHFNHALTPQHGRP